MVRLGLPEEQAMTDSAEKVVAEWRDAMEGVTPGPWSFSGLKVFFRRVEAVIARCRFSEGYLPLLEEAAEKNAAWIARCSPSGISALLALIESQRATIERVERERDEALKLARHLRVAQIIYDDGPDESDKAQADLHMSAAILLAKRLVPWGDTRVSDAEAHAPRAHLTGGRDV
jgi:hypothetical protein